MNLILSKTLIGDAAITMFSAPSQAGVVVVNGSTNDIKLPAAALANSIVGVLAYPGLDTNLAGEVVLIGVTKVRSDGSAAIKAGQYLVVADNTGKVKALSFGDGTSLRGIVGIAMSDCANGVVGDVECFVLPQTYNGA